MNISPEDQAAFDYFSLRQYQINAIMKVRELVREGKKNILICAPTGSGKTRIAACIIYMSRNKGTRSAFLVDRINLVDQTSTTFDDYKISHGVMQSSHWRFRPYERAQICSIQTIARRQWPDADMIVVDECHVVHKVTKDRIEKRDTTALGLTATPFTKGLGKIYDALVNVATTNELIATGALASFRIFAASQPDMDGVKVVAGEWEEKETSKRAMEVVGDCVVEYLKHGDSKKFICSAVDIAHANELQRQFMGAGVMCVSYTSDTPDEECADIVKEFRKPDSYIRGLVTVTKATKGFDVPDIGVVIMARPLRKSLAEHIQLFGRGLRSHPGKTECLARGTLVLTDRGEVPIELVTLDHLVWDGVNFVRHGGAVCKGVRPVIEYDGLIATPDHEVMTDDGWTRFEDAASGERRIVRTGIAGRPVRFVDDHVESMRRVELSSQGLGQVLGLQSDEHGSVLQYGQAADGCELPRLPWSTSGEGSGVAVQACPSDAISMHEFQCDGVCELRRSRDRVSVCIGERSSALDCGESWNSIGPQDANRSAGERGELRARKSALDDATSKCEQHSPDNQNEGQKQVSGVSSSLSGGSVCRQDVGQAFEVDDLRRGVSAVFQPSVDEAEREVWDVLNAGPLQRFTANGRLVHNCLVLDHSGNSERFWDEWNEFFETGALELDDGKKKPPAKKKPKDEADAMVKCSNCKHLHKPMPFCPACGHEYPKRESVKHVAGTLSELVASGDRKAMSAQLWPQIVGYARERREGEAARKLALALFKKMTDQWPTGEFESTQAAPLTREVANKIRSLNIAFAKGRQKASANQSQRAA